MSDETPKGGEDGAPQDLAALDHRVAKLEKNAAKSAGPWYKTPSNVISLLAVLATVGVFLLSFLYTQQEARFDKRQALLSVVEQLSALVQEESRIAQANMPLTAKINANIAVANRRVALVTQADDLLDDVFSEASRLDLSMLAVAYAQVGRFEQAEQHFLSLAEAQDEPTNLRVMAWRSLVSMYFHIGESRIQDAVSAHDAGLELLSDATDLQSEMMRVALPMSMSDGLLALRRYEKAAPYLFTAENRAWNLPCAPARTQALDNLQGQVRKLHLSAPDHARGLIEVREIYSDGCADDPQLFPVSANSGDVEEFVGQYEGHSRRIAINLNKNDHLELSFVGQPGSFPLRPIGEGFFVIPSRPGYYLSTERDENGSPDSVLLIQPNGVFRMSP